nr:hypothetical protein [Arthrobacter agilis]
MTGKPDGQRLRSELRSGRQVEEGADIDDDGDVQRRHETEEALRILAPVADSDDLTHPGSLPPR